MKNIYNIDITSNFLSITGTYPATVIFDPTLYVERTDLPAPHKIIYKITYNFAPGIYKDIIYTQYPSSFNLDNIIPQLTPVEYTYKDKGTHYCYISVFEVGTDVQTITATISLSANEILDLYLLKSSMYGVQENMLYVLESEDPNLVLPLFLNWKNKKTTYIDPLQYPTPTPTSSQTPTPSVTPTISVTPTTTITFTPTPTNTPTITPSITPTNTSTPTNTPTTTPTPSITPSITPTSTTTPTPTPSQTLPVNIVSSQSYRYSGKGVKRYKFNVPAGSQFSFSYNAGQVPDKFNIISIDDNIIYTTGWAGEEDYNSYLIAAGKPPVESPSIGNIVLTNDTLFDFIIIEVEVIFSSSLGQITLTLL